MRYFIPTMVLTMSVTMTAAAQFVDLVTCGVREPWATEHFDNFFHDNVGCTQAFVDDAWNRFDMGEDDNWHNYGAVDEDPCNTNTPLGRTISALSLLAFAGTDSPTDNFNDENPLNWGYVFAGNAIHYLEPVCDHPGRSASTVFGTFELNPRTELHKAFFYDEDVPMRAAALFHESRHADAWCDHTDNCPAGAGGCDPNWDNGCVGFSSSAGPGAYAWTVMWLNWYASHAQPFLINDDIRTRAIQAANAFLARDFEQPPCFVLGSDGAAVAIPGC